jgi:hypothetical protein
MEFKGYALHVDGPSDPMANPDAPDEAGYYHLTTLRDEITNELTATACNDLLADSADKYNPGEVLNGLGGNDLIFSHGYGDTLIGGAGNDLLVINGAATIVLSTNDEDSLDTIVGFGEDSVIDLGMETVSYLDADEINEILSEGGSDEVVWDNFISALGDADVVEFDDMVNGYLSSVSSNELFGEEFFTAINGKVLIVHEESGAHMMMFNGVGIAQQPVELAHFADFTNFTADNFMTQAVLPV